MDEIQFVSLKDVAEEKIISLMNDPRVTKHLPLLEGEFSCDSYKAFIESKAKMWDEYGYGPWAFFIKGQFAGWGGLQPENDEVDFALVLHPDFWGWGIRIFQKVKLYAFETLAVSSLIILLPPDRRNSKVIERFGFLEEGETQISNKKFRKFRLRNIE